MKAARIRAVSFPTSQKYAPIFFNEVNICRRLRLRTEFRLTRIDIASALICRPTAVVDVVVDVSRC